MGGGGPPLFSTLHFQNKIESKGTTAHSTPHKETGNPDFSKPRPAKHHPRAPKAPDPPKKKGRILLLIFFSRMQRQPRRQRCAPTFLLISTENSGGFSRFFQTNFKSERCVCRYEKFLLLTNLHHTKPAPERTQTKKKEKMKSPTVARNPKKKTGKFFLPFFFINSRPILPGPKPIFSR